MDTMLALPPARRSGRSWHLCLLMGLTLLVIFAHIRGAADPAAAPPAAARP
ncbi:MAG: hypothetical protein IT545_11795 [Rhodobacteraceae bacterium]|nr:hypothetical protein [Paracoccaceae bacterium]